MVLWIQSSDSQLNSRWERYSCGLKLRIKLRISINADEATTCLCNTSRGCAKEFFALVSFLFLLDWRLIANVTILGKVQWFALLSLLAATSHNQPSLQTRPLLCIFYFSLSFLPSLSQIFYFIFSDTISFCRCY